MLPLYKACFGFYLPIFTQILRQGEKEERGEEERGGGSHTPPGLVEKIK